MSKEKLRYKKSTTYFYKTGLIMAGLLLLLIFAGCGALLSETGQPGNEPENQGPGREHEETTGQIEECAAEDVDLGQYIDLEIDISCRVYPEQFAPVPDFSLESLEGETVELGDYCNVPLILLFWTDNCPNSRIALELLETLYQSDQGIEVLGISDLDEETVKKYKEAHNISYPMLLDFNKKVFDAYMVEELPSAVVINAQGTLSSIFKGFFNADTIESMRRRALLQWELYPIIK